MGSPHFRAKSSNGGTSSDAEAQENRRRTRLEMTIPRCHLVLIPLVFPNLIVQSARHQFGELFRPALAPSVWSGRVRPRQKAKISFQTSLKILSPNPDSDFSRS